MRTFRARRSYMFFFLVIALAAVLGGCKKDDDNPSNTGTGGITTISFGDPAPAVTVATGNSSQVKLAGGTLPYVVTSSPSLSVAAVTISNDTLTITPIGSGSTSVTIRDATPGQEETATPKIITIMISVTEGNVGNGNPFDFPIPDVPNLNGGVGVVAFGTFVNGIGVFEEANNFVYAGTVQVNSAILDTMTYGSDVIYMGDVSTAVTFNNSASAGFTVAGANGVPSFTASIVPPTTSSITAPASMANLPLNANLTVQWNNATPATDTLIIVIENYLTGKTVYKTSVPNTGSYVIPSGDLAALGAGDCLVTVAKYRYSVKTVGAKKYLVLAESVAYVYVHFL